MKGVLISGSGVDGPGWDQSFHSEQIHTGNKCEWLPVTSSISSPKGKSSH